MKKKMPGFWIKPGDPEKLATHPATLLRDSCGTPARVVRESLLSISGIVPKHFDVLSSKMMLRSLPEVGRSSKNDETFDKNVQTFLIYEIFKAKFEFKI